MTGTRLVGLPFSFLHPSKFSAFRRASPNFKPVHSVIIVFPSLFLLPFPSPSLCDALYDHLFKSCRSCYKPIPSQFAFSHGDEKIFIGPYSISDIDTGYLVRMHHGDPDNLMVTKNGQ